MTEKERFGELAGDYLSIGDIVEWSRWNSDNENWDVHYGIISGIKNEIRSSRMVSISRVIPLAGSSSEIEFFTLSLRLVSPSIREEVKS